MTDIRKDLAPPFNHDLPSNYWQIGWEDANNNIDDKEIDNYGKDDETDLPFT
jgi:hypothetical protein